MILFPSRAGGMCLSSLIARPENQNVEPTRYVYVHAWIVNDADNHVPVSNAISTLFTNINALIAQTAASGLTG